MTARKRRKTKKDLERIAVFLKSKTTLVLICLNLVAIAILLNVIAHRKQEENAPLYYRELVQAACEEFDVPQELVFAVIRVESNFRADAESEAGARGLMQITSITLEEINTRLGTDYDFGDMFDAQTNIRCGTFYLSYLYKRFGDSKTVYAAYNAGPTVVSRWLMDERYAPNGTLIQIPYPETEKYVEKVSKFREEYIKLYKEKIK